MFGLNFVAGEVEVSFLYPHCPTASFHYPNQPDILIMSCQDILTTVNPTTSTGRANTLTENEIEDATRTLANRI